MIQATRALYNPGGALGQLHLYQPYSFRRDCVSVIDYEALRSIGDYTAAWLIAPKPASDNDLALTEQTNRYIGFQWVHRLHNGGMTCAVP